MSLIYLKNDDNSVVDGRPNGMLPYRWSNYFTQPLKIAPNSQVAYISSSFNLNPSAELNGSPAYFIIGNAVLNKPVAFHIDKIQINDTEGINYLSEVLNNYGSDGNFNHIYINNNTQAYDGILQNEEFDTGFNFLRNSNDKTDIRLTQRGVNDVFQQGFNAVATNPTKTFSAGATYGAGLNTGTGTNSTIFNQIGFDREDAPTPNKVSYNPSNCLQPQVNTGAVALPLNPFSNFYNTGYASNFMSDVAGTGGNGAVLNWGSQSALTLNYNFFNTGSFGMLSTRTGIKQFVDSNAGAVMTDNGGGHASISAIANGFSGGYALYTFAVQPQALANTHFDAAYTGGGDVGFAGISAQSFGVHSVDYIYKNNGATEAASRANFVAGMDLNASIVGGSTNALTGALGAKARYLMGVDLVELGGDLVAQVRVLDPNSTLENSTYNNVGNQLSLKALCNGSNTATTPATAFGGSPYNLNTFPATNTAANLVFRFRWTSPYTMCVEFMLSTAVATSYNLVRDEPYQPSTIAPISNDPRTSWCMLYDMKQDYAAGKAYYIPSWFGDIGLVAYPHIYRHSVFTKGYYDVRRTSQVEERITAGEDNANAYEGLQDGLFFVPKPFSNCSLFSKGNGANDNVPALMSNIIPEEFSPTGISKKKVYMILNEQTDLDYEDEFLDIAGNTMIPIYQPAQLELGKQTGIIAVGGLVLNTNIAGGANEYVLQGFNGLLNISGLNSTFCNHIQLTNLPIQSQQGVKSTMNKTIYIINSLNVASNKPVGSNDYKYGDIAPYLVWIDLNNLGEMLLNKIDVLITDDDNKAQKRLKYDTDVVIMIREKPKSDEGYMPNNIKITGNSQNF